VLEQLTFDHSLVWEMKAAGQLQGGDLPNFVPKNIITRSLGPHDQVQVDLEGPFPLEEGDTFLLCSDGLTGQVTDEEIGAILGALGPQQAARMLIDLANLRGGPDNITVIVAKANRVLPSENVAAPPSANRPSKLASVHPGIWVSIGVCLLGAALCGLVGYWLAAIVLVFLGVLVAVIALGSEPTTNAPVANTPISERFGSAPHMTLDCRPTAQSVQSLSDVERKLHEAAREEQWAIDWDQLRTREHAAKTAVAEGDFIEATRQYCLAIGHMMNDLRKGGSPPPSASVIA
jgi:protein phosphatase